MKAGFVTIVGKPNVGKSTLLNRFVGSKLSAITSKPQTTRHSILGIWTEDDNQIVFVDTPGFFKPHNELDKAMRYQIKRNSEDTDVTLLMVSADDIKLPGNVLSFFKSPVFLLINKIDMISREELAKILELFNNSDFDEIIPISALKGYNTEDLISLILEYLPQEHPYFPEDYLSDRPERFFIEEIMREKIFEEYRQEIPYSTTVKVIDMKDNRIDINIFVEKESQKGIIIGKGGNKLKKVSTIARKEIEKFLGKHVYIKTWIKVRKKWRKNKQAIMQFGYYE